MDYPSGWTCERTIRLFESYLQSTLELLDCLAIAEHLEACEDCAQRVVLYRQQLLERARG